MLLLSRRASCERVIEGHQRCLKLGTEPTADQITPRIAGRRSVAARASNNCCNPRVAYEPNDLVKLEPAEHRFPPAKAVTRHPPRYHSGFSFVAHPGLVLELLLGSSRELSSQRSAP